MPASRTGLSPRPAIPWILVVDADERMTEELAAEIRGVLAHENPSVDAYGLRRQNYFLGHPIRHCGWNRTTVNRLFRRDVCHTAPRGFTLLQVAPGRAGTLRNRLLHYTCRSLSSWMEKHTRMRPSGPKTITPPAVERAGWEFLPGPRCGFCSSIFSAAAFSMGPPA